MSEQKQVKGVEGACCRDASFILNSSQGTPSEAQANMTGRFLGHPRYHVLCNRNVNTTEIINNLEQLGCTEAVTTAQGNTKSAFLTREDQNRTLHEILSSSKGKEALDILNSGRTEVVLKTPVHELNENRNLKLAIVANGQKTEIKDAKSTVLLLGHHVNKSEGMYVHVKTFYPTDKNIDGNFLSVTRQ